MLTDPQHIKILTGCAAELVADRRLVNAYQTNRTIKTWSHYFLLKHLTSSGILKNWTKQKADLLQFTKMNENCFRTRLREMVALKLCTVHKNSRDITLTSYQNAAEILGIIYQGTHTIEYKTSTNANQFFQYLLRGEDIRQNQQEQLKELMRKVNKNPLLRDQLNILLQQQFGASQKQLKQRSFFQEKLLQLQIDAFKHGSTLYAVIHSLRADINRSVKGMQQAHNCKSASTISYAKKVMQKYGLLNVEKKTVDSKADVRSRLKLPDGKDGYKWFKHKNTTAWVLCDQLTFTYATRLQPPKIKPTEREKQNLKNAA